MTEAGEALLRQIWASIQVTEQKVVDLAGSLPREVGRMEKALDQQLHQINENRRWMELENTARKEEINRLTQAQIGEHQFAKGWSKGAVFVIGVIGAVMVEGLRACVAYFLHN
jgi:hypothetical protein